MSLHLWEAIHDADARSEPLFEIDPALRRLPVLAAGDQLFQLMATEAFAEGLLDDVLEWSEVA